MSPSDFGELLKPFVFLDLFEHEGPPFTGGLHPYSGIATLTYVTEGSVNYIDPDNVKGVLTAGGVEWMQAGRGMWHGGGISQGRTRGFQLWIALPPDLELGPAKSLYQAPDEVQIDGPARIASLNALAVAKQHLGDLDRLKKLVKLTVLIATTEQFVDHAPVADGASDLFVQIFGQETGHVRLVYGVQSLPIGAPVIVDTVFEIEVPPYSISKPQH